ncbi:MAG TPA: glutathione S-transferase family protein [Nitrobacter sp.]|nr:glutathione S-transferase family protein [Nitrobacter sp.]
MAEPDIILHHYPRSPFAEKVRVAFGLKGVNWRSVEQPRLAPKPDLTALTGGYRRIPVMQIGADVYCDTRCILRELERRRPRPSLYPAGTAGLADMIAAWADRDLFAAALGLVFGLHGDRFPPELHADRARFTAGRFDGWNSGKMRTRIFDLRHQLAHQCGWIEQTLAHDGGFILGNEASVADLAIYHPLWYLRGNLDADSGLDSYPRVLAWMARMDAIGHGTVQDLSPEASLAVARGSSSAAIPHDTADAANLWQPGMRVTVTPDDWGFDPVEGEIVRIGADAIALRRSDPAAGAVTVHFPLRGFEVKAA